MKRGGALLPGLALTALALVAYLPVLRGEFIWDDDNVVTQSVNVQGGLDGLMRLWAGDAPDYFPLTWTLFWVEHKLWGLNATGYHAVNVFLHAVSAVLVWRVLARLEVRGAWLGAALFAVHPVCVASAAWITEGKNTLSLALGAACVLAYLRWREGDGPYLPALLLFAAALLAKSALAPLPLALATVAWWKRGRLDAADARGLLPLVVLAGAAAVSSVWFQKHHAIFIDTVRPEGAASRLAAAGWAIWHYLRIEVFPWDLPPIHPRWDVDPARPLAWLPLLAAVAVLVLLAWKRSSWGRGPLAAAICWLALLAPVLGAFDIYFMKYSLVADHWAYLATVVAMACLGAALARLPTAAVAPVAAVIVVASLALTMRQSAVYASSDTLWRTAIARNPEAWVAWHNLGWLQQTTNPDEAMKCYQAALALRPDYALSHHNLGVLLAARGQIDEAMGHYERALESRPDYPMAHLDLARVLQAKGRIDAAVEHYRKVVELQPDFVEGHLALSAALLVAGQPAEAARAAEAGLALRPGDPTLEYNLALALERQGQWSAALQHYEAVLRARPDFAPAMTRAAWILAVAPDDGLRNGRRALELAAVACRASADADALDALAAAEAECGQFRPAVESATRAAQQASGPVRAEIEKRVSLYNAMLPYRAPRSR